MRRSRRGRPARRSLPGLRAVAFLLLAACLLAACTRHYHSERFGYLDPGPGQKNIVVPLATSGLAEEIIEALRARGWNTLEPTADNRVDKAEERVALYTLKVESDFVSKCVTWDNFVRYEISVEDNRTGDTLFTMAGQRCDSKVVHQFMTLLEQTGPKRR